MIVHAVAALLPPKAPMWVYGLAREGIASIAGANTALRPLYMNVRTVAVEKMSININGTPTSAGHTCTVQVIGCVRGAAAVKGSRDTLAGWAKDPDVTVFGKTLSWRVYPGLFAGGTLGMWPLDCYKETVDLPGFDALFVLSGCSMSIFPPSPVFTSISNRAMCRVPCEFPSLILHPTPSR